MSSINKDFNVLSVYDFIIKTNCGFIWPESTVYWIPFSQIKILNEIAKGGYGIIYKAIWSYDESMYKSHYYESYRGEFQVALKKFLNPRDFKKYFLNEEHAKVRWHIGDLGLSHPENDSLFNKEIYGVIPYIAPEIFKGAKFSQASDIYSLGMIMWECTTGCKPFANIEHDHNLIYNIIDGKRPEITEDTPEFLANLMKRCWDSDPKNRPTAWMITKMLPIEYHYSYYYFYIESIESLYNEIREAEQKRLELIRLKKLGPEFAEKPHSKAIYTSRPIRSSYTNSSNSLTKSLSSVNSLNTKQGYISREYEFDIKGSQSSSHSNARISRANIKGSNNKKYDSKELEFDIDEIQSLSSSSIYSTIKKFFFRKAKQKA
ncbi:kinase-like domain-containing protein [Rhizophagus diaphanus]|nr:kinase-like domain-containing protein [Rhizophagus diaphanus] [Rhizophagus sp. MUCL 43196]